MNFKGHILVQSYNTRLEVNSLSFAKNTTRHNDLEYVDRGKRKLFFAMGQLVKVYPCAVKL